MKKSHIVIAAVVAGAAGFLYWRSRKKPSTAATTTATAPATSSTTSSALQNLATRISSAFAPVREAKITAEPTPRTAADVGLDISSPYGNESI